jgi:hypothetical protein
MYHSPDVTRKWYLPAGIHQAGRKSSCALAFADVQAVSRVHAQFRVDESSPQKLFVQVDILIVQACNAFNSRSNALTIQLIHSFCRTGHEVKVQHACRVSQAAARDRAGAAARADCAVRHNSTCDSACSAAATAGVLLSSQQAAAQRAAASAQQAGWPTARCFHTRLHPPCDWRRCRLYH